MSLCATFCRCLLCSANFNFSWTFPSLCTSQKNNLWSFLHIFRCIKIFSFYLLGCLVVSFLCMQFHYWPLFVLPSMHRPEGREQRRISCSRNFVVINSKAINATFQWWYLWEGMHFNNCKIFKNYKVHK